MPRDIDLTCKYFREGRSFGDMCKIVHSIPINELDEHNPTMKCKCKPKLEIVDMRYDPTIDMDEVYLIMHNSFVWEQIEKSLNN